MIDLREPPRPRSRLAQAAWILSRFALCVTLFALLLLRSRTVEASAGFPAFLSSLALAALAVPLGLLALAVVWQTGARGVLRATGAIVLAAALLAGPVFVAVRGGSAPQINDVSTDLDDPPRFTQAPRDRKGGDLPVPVAIPAAQAEAQRAGYPDIAPLRLAVSPEDAANLALSLVEERGWRVVGRGAYPRGGGPTGRIEAVATTSLLALEDDVSIRVRPEGDGGSRVDMRSASRIGRSDLGANAARIKAFLAELSEQAGAAQ